MGCPGHDPDGASPKPVTDAPAWLGLLLDGFALAAVLDS
jgi:hypothetical protein